MGKHISKQERQKQASEKQRNEQKIQVVFAHNAKLQRGFSALVQEAQNWVGTGKFSNNAVVYEIQYFIEKNKNKTKKVNLEKWIANLTHLGENVQNKSPKWLQDASYVRALLELGKYRSYWIRNVEDWKPKSKNPYQQFTELMQHLFAYYPFPAFMNHIFFYEQDHHFIPDFIFLAQGGSIKHIYSSIPLTQKMKALFMQSPDGFRIFEAFRYAQVLGLGGDEALAHRIAYSALGANEVRIQEANGIDESFWEQFFRILVAGGMFDHEKIGELIDYVNHQKRCADLPTPYSLKGRTLASLIRQSDEWHNEMQEHAKKINGKMAWKPCGLNGFEMVEGKDENEVRYELVELLSSNALIEEGRKMNHCVGTYSHACNSGRTAIFSLRKSRFGLEEERLATIELNLHAKRIVQAKYRYNKAIGNKATQIMQEWAMEAGLRTNIYL